MSKRLACYLLFFLASLSLAAQVPAGYYNGTNGLYGNPLRTALHQIIDGHTALSYSQLFSYFPSTDARANNSVWDMYSDVPGGVSPYIYYFVPADQCGNYSQEGDCFNREHSFPKSWFGGEVMPMYSDLFHVYPTDGYVNNQRGNLPFGETNAADWTSLNGSKRGPSAITGYSGSVFEPIDEYKGDLARSCFYMAVRYYSEDAGWPGSAMTNGAEPLPWALSMLILWHQQDTVSLKERNRNDAVYLLQGNRNPFIDDPYFAERIWTTSAGTYTSAVQEPAWTIDLLTAHNTLTLTALQETPVACRVTLIDIYGRTCRQEYIPAGQDELSINIGSFSDAIYILRIEESGAQNPYVRKIMILSP